MTIKLFFFTILKPFDITVFTGPIIKPDQNNFTHEII